MFDIRVQPKSSKSGVVGERGKELKVALHSPPEDGQANAELLTLLSKILKVSKGEMEIVSGQKSRSKKILLIGLEHKAKDIVRKLLGG